MNNFLKKNKQHIIFISILLLLLVIFFNGWFNSERFWLGELDSGSYDAMYVAKKSIVEYNEFPLWLPNYQGGSVLFAHPNYLVFFYTTILSLIMPTVLALNLSLLLNMFLGGLFMYMLMINFKYKPKIAFVSALIYMFSIAQIHVFTSYLFRSGVVALAPLVYLCFWKALHDKKWIKWSIIAGMVFVLQFHSNGLNWFMFMSLVVMSIFFTYLIGRNIKKRILKMVFVGAIVGVVFLGLAAVRIFSLTEYGEVSSKQGDFSFEDSVGNKIDIKNLKDFVKYFLIVPDGRGFHQYSTEIGIGGFILVLFSFFKWRKKHVLGLIILAVLALLVGTGSPVFYLMWKFIPGFSKLHHVERVGYVFVLAAAPLAGIGLSVLLSKLKKYGKKIKTGVYLLVLGLVFVDSFVFTLTLADMSDDYKFNFKNMVEDNHLMQYISKDDDIFRINNIKTNRHSGHAGPYAVHLDQEILYGGTSLWYPELYVFLGIAHSLPAKFSGMLNTKYIYSDEEIDKPFLTFVKKFEECDNCYEHEPVDHGVDGPYLYYNELYLPRAYLAENSILVIGDKGAVDQTTYSLMMDDDFDPSNNVIVMVYSKVDDIDLSKFDAVFLTQGSVDENSGFVLKQYVDNGGILLPNVVAGQNSITQEDVDNLLKLFWGDYENVKKIDITYYSPNKRYMELKGEEGWMVLAEKFHMFEGWEPEINNDKLPIYRANGMNSAVYLEGYTGELRFEYTPKSFRKGLTISLITLILIIVFFVWNGVKNKKSKVFHK